MPVGPSTSEEEVYTQSITNCVPMKQISLSKDLHFMKDHYLKRKWRFLTESITLWSQLMSGQLMISTALLANSRIRGQFDNINTYTFLIKIVVTFINMHILCSCQNLASVIFLDFFSRLTRPNFKKFLEYHTSHSLLSHWALCKIKDS